MADLLMRPMWRNLCGTLERIVPPPPGKRLWYDQAGIPFLAEDVKDAADVLAVQATAIRTLVDGGYDADSVVDAVTSGDLSRLEGEHTGLVPVQLQKPGSTAPADKPNDSGDAEPAPTTDEEAPDAVAPDEGLTAAPRVDVSSRGPPARRATRSSASSRETSRSARRPAARPSSPDTSASSTSGPRSRARSRAGSWSASPPARSPGA